MHSLSNTFFLVHLLLSVTSLVEVMQVTSIVLSKFCNSLVKLTRKSLLLVASYEQSILHCGQCTLAYNPHSNNVATGSGNDF